ncbi:MAG: hypothetical protein AAGC55_20420 [Myxococcota bacterium]
MNSISADEPVSGNTRLSQEYIDRLSAATRYSDYTAMPQEHCLTWQHVYGGGVSAIAVPRSADWPPTLRVDASAPLWRGTGHDFAQAVWLAYHHSGVDLPNIRISSDLLHVAALIVEDDVDVIVAEASCRYVDQHLASLPCVAISGEYSRILLMGQTASRRGKGPQFHAMLTNPRSMLRHAGPPVPVLEFDRNGCGPDLGSLLVATLNLRDGEDNRVHLYVRDGCLYDLSADSASRLAVQLIEAAAAARAKSDR